MELVPTGLPGLQIIRPKIFRDARGTFIKTFNADTFRQFGLAFEPHEEFFSTSAKGVVRGMHFQLPPAAHAKLVYCIFGSVLDVVLDLRKNSPTYGQAYRSELNATNRESLFIPVGFAHGFLALEEGATMVYQTGSSHSPSHDAGIRWDSFGFNWPVNHPLLSERDQKFPGFGEFSSPF